MPGLPSLTVVMMARPLDASSRSSMSSLRAAQQEGGTGQASSGVGAGGRPAARAQCTSAVPPKAPPVLGAAGLPRGAAHAAAPAEESRPLVGSSSSRMAGLISSS